MHPVQLQLQRCQEGSFKGYTHQRLPSAHTQSRKTEDVDDNDNKNKNKNIIIINSSSRSNNNNDADDDDGDVDNTLYEV
jgi:hypothetical protein